MQSVYSISPLGSSGSRKRPLGTPLNRNHPLAQGLAARWTFAEGAGRRLVDVSGANLHGAISGCTWKPSPRGMTLSFNGTSDEIVLGSHAAFAFASNSAFTICIWLKPATADESGYLIGKFDGTGWALRFDGVNNIVWLVKDGYANAAWSEAVFTDTDWVHFALSFNGGIATFYRNGMAAGGGGGATWTTPVDPIAVLGNRSGGSSTGTYFAGAMDDVAIYRRALSASEIYQLYLDSYCMFASEPWFFALSPAVLGPYRTTAAQTTCSGAAAGQDFHAGAILGQDYHTGITAGQCHG